MAYNNNNSGVLFPNDKKQSDKHPDFKGSANINGVEVWLAGWKRTSQNGNRFISISIEPKEDRAQADGGFPAGNDELDL